MHAPATAATEAGPPDDLSRFEAMYRAYSAYIWAVLARLGVDAVADAHQEVFITAYRRRDTFDVGRPVKPWLLGIARKVAFRYRRSKTRRSRKHDALVLAHGIGGGSRQEIRDRLEARDFLVRFLDELPPTRREIFVRGELEGQTGREIAQTLDLGIDAVYGQLRSARAQLRTRLLAVEAAPMPRQRVERGLALLVPQLRVEKPAPWVALPSKALLMVLGVSATAGVVLALGVLGGSGAGADVVGASISSGSERVEAVGEIPGVETPGNEIPNYETPGNEIPNYEAPGDEIPGNETPGKPGDDGVTVASSAIHPGQSLVDPSEPSVAPGRPIDRAPTQATSIEPTMAASDRRYSDTPTITEVSSAEDTSEQTRRLVEVRRALLAGRPRVALAQLEAHARDFPRTPHAELRDALRVDALCALGRSAQARGEARILLRRYPGSNVARHAQTVCADD